MRRKLVPLALCLALGSLGTLGACSGLTTQPQTPHQDLLASGNATDDAKDSLQGHPGGGAGPSPGHGGPSPSHGSGPSPSHGGGSHH